MYVYNCECMHLCGSYDHLIIRVLLFVQAVYTKRLHTVRARRGVRRRSTCVFYHMQGAIDPKDLLEITFTFMRE